MISQRVTSVYLREIDILPPQSADEERELTARVGRGDPEARDLLIRANLRLVVRIAKGCCGRGLELDDLVAEGNLGLIRAVESFDPSIGVRFSTYASYWIKQAMRRALQNQGKLVRLPAYIYTLLAKWKRAACVLEERLGRAPTVEEVGRALELSRKKVLITVEALDAERRFGARREGEEPSLDVSAVGAETPEASLISREDLKRALEGFCQLGEREATVIRLRFGLGGTTPESLRETGRRLGVTYERVRQIERIALAKLREHVQG